METTKGGEFRLLLFGARRRWATSPVKWRIFQSIFYIRSAHKEDDPQKEEKKGVKTKDLIAEEGEEEEEGYVPREERKF